MDTTTRIALIAAAMMHVEGSFSSKSMGFLRNNPGNLREASGDFCMFANKQDGFDALILDIRDNDYKTLRSFLFKYAPPRENDTEMYVEEVSSLTGILPDERIKLGE